MVPKARATSEEFSVTNLDFPDLHSFTAELLRASATGLASATAQRWLAARTDRAAGGPEAFGQWKSALESQLDSLAAALGARRPEIFADHVRWSRWVCIARQVPENDLRAALVALGEVVREELPPASGALAGEVVAAAIAEFDRVPAEPPSHVEPDTPHGRFAARYLLALLEGDRDAAIAAVDAARSDQVAIPEIYTAILQPALAEIGRLWMLGDIHVAEEHFATATTALIVSRLFAELPRSLDTGTTVITASVEGELHELGIRMVSDFFTMDGWRVIHLGASIPAPDLRQGVIDFHADLVAFSVSLPIHLSSTRAIIDTLRSDPETRGIPILVGGSAFAHRGDLWRDLGADGCATEASEAVAIGRSLVGLAPRES